MDDKIQKIKEFVKEKSKGEASGHDYYHALRVWRNAKEIAKDFRGIDYEVVEISALVHDLVDDKVNLMTREELVDKLREFGVDEEKIHSIMDVVDKISFRKNVPKEELSIEARIVQDADRLDALGAIGIARVFAYSGKAGRPIYDPDINPEMGSRGKSKTAINHFYEKLFLIKEELNTDKAKRIAERRERVMVEFLEEFFEEWEGRR